MGGVTDVASPHYVRQGPRKRTEQVQVKDFTMLVRVPGRPGAVRVFTDAEEDEARRYATDTGGTVVPLPLPMPDSNRAVIAAAAFDGSTND